MKITKTQLKEMIKKRVSRGNRMKINETMIRKIVTEMLREGEGADEPLGRGKETTATTRSGFMQGAKDIAAAGGVTAQEKALLSLVFKKMLAAAKKGTINSGLPLQHLQRFLAALEKIGPNDQSGGDSDQDMGREDV